MFININEKKEGVKQLTISDLN